MSNMAIPIVIDNKRTILFFISTSIWKGQQKTKIYFKPRQPFGFFPTKKVGEFAQPACRRQGLNLSELFPMF
jgi:hypothetical protein